MKANNKNLPYAAILTLLWLLVTALCAVNPPATSAQKSGTKTSQQNYPDELADIRKIRIGAYGNTDRVAFDLYKEWDSDATLQKPPAFRTVYKTHPQRLIITFEGVSTVTATVRPPKNHRIVEAVYKIPLPSKNEQTIVVALKSPASFDALQLEKPARIAIDITKKRQEQSGKNLYSVRTQSYEQTAYNLSETLVSTVVALTAATGHDAQIIQSDNNTLFIEAGLYETTDEAQKEMEKLSSLPYDFLIEERSPSSIPQAFFPAPAPVPSTDNPDWVRIDVQYQPSSPLPNILIDFSSYKQGKDSVSVKACLVMPNNTRTEFTASIKCPTKLFDVISSKSYDSRAQPIGSESSKEPKWTPIVAGTYIEDISTYACYGSKSRKPAEFAKMRTLRDRIFTTLTSTETRQPPTQPDNNEKGETDGPATQ